MVKTDAKVFEGKSAELDAFKKANADKVPSLVLVPDARGAFLKADKKSELLRFVREVKVPDDVLIGYEFVEDKDLRTGQVKSKFWRTYNLTAKTELTGDNLTRAQVGPGQKGEWVVNREPAILGADNKATVAGMVDGLRRIARDGIPHAGIELVITVQEEIGLLGAKAFDMDRLEAEVGYVYDVDGDPGAMTMRAPSQITLDLAFRGRAAHEPVHARWQQPGDVRVRLQRWHQLLLAIHLLVVV